MYFSEQERRVYQPPGSERQYDPLHVDRVLVVRSRNQLNALVAARNARYERTGDVSPAGLEQTAVDGAAAELELVELARVAFELPSFPKCLDAEALEILYHFLGWMEGKDGRDGYSPPAPATEG